MESSTDFYNLQRFIDAQESTYEAARREMSAGQKRSHWMWFIFPQIQGLGSSPTAQRYAIANLEEGAAYLRHPLLGKRLENCTELVNAIRGCSVADIFGYPDDLKFHSSVTLFARVAEEFGIEAPVFKEALVRHFADRMDAGTLRQLGAPK